MLFGSSNLWGALIVRIRFGVIRDYDGSIRGESS